MGQYRDQFGHAEGDKVLKLFSDALPYHFRSYDVIARLGGDEFCVFCTDINQTHVDNVVQRLKNSLHNDSPKEYKIECSFGSIQYNKKEHPTLEYMLALADSKMYIDKKSK